MLADLRRALADTIAAGMPEALVLSYPPLTVDFPDSGVFVWVEPDEGAYLDAWLTMGTSGRGTVTYEIVVTCPDLTNPEEAWRLMDDATDPISTKASVFAGILADRSLGVSDFQCEATPLLGQVASARRVLDNDGTTVRYEIRLPVVCHVQRS